MRKKVAVSMFMGMSLRNFEATGILKAINEHADVTILTHSHHFATDLQDKYKVEIISIPNRAVLKLMELLEPLQYYTFHYAHQPKTSRKYLQRDRDQKPIKWCIWTILGFIWSRFAGIFSPRNCYEFLSKFWPVSVSKYDEIVLLSYDVIFDKLLAGKTISENKSLNIVAHSWDNLPARGYLPAAPNKLFVWNNYMADQAVHYHQIERKKIIVFGAPQFQHYLQLSKKIPVVRIKELSESLEPKKFIVYCCSASRVFPDEPIFIEKLKIICDELNLKMVLRLHPSERHQFLKGKFSKQENIFFSKAGEHFSASLPKTKTDDNAFREIEDFIVLMRDSLCVVNLASTTSIDSIVHGTPAICINFNVDSSIKSQWNRADDWYNSDHYSYLLKSNAVILTQTLEDLKDRIQGCKSGNYPAKEMKHLTEEFVTEIKPHEIFVKELTGDLK